jgi:3-phosphoshikimate 1-carboxyvinyltransferase
MKNYFIKKSTLSGEISLPSSKSQTIRAILFASIASGKSKIKNFLKSDDIYAFIEGCSKFKAKIFIKKNNLEIIGTNKKILVKENDKVDIKNSGLALRLLTSIYALSDKSILITGDTSIRNNRSMKPLIESLNTLGASIKCKELNDFAPLEIKGPFFAGSIKINGNDSQHVSSLLIASSLLKNNMEIEVESPSEKPWVKMTLDWLDRFKVKYENNNFEKFKIFAPNRFKAFEYLVPSDFSSALFPIVGALITNSEILLKDIVFDDSQNDQTTIEIFRKFGANIHIDKEKKIISVNKSCLKGDFTIDVNDFIDSLPIIAVFGCFNEGRIILKNASMARKKESNRIFAITNELKKMNGKITETEDGLIVEKSDLKAAVVNSYNDHRIAMALCIASLAVSGVTTIEDISCISKTYPDFKEDLKKLGAKIL